MGKRPRIVCRFGLEFYDDAGRPRLMNVTARGPSMKSAKRAAIARGREEMQRTLNTERPAFRGFFSETCAFTDLGDRLPHLKKSRVVAGAKKRRR